MLLFIIFSLKIIEAFASTFATILIVNEKKLYASIISFLQVLIWFLIIKLALNNNSITIAFIYAGGYAIGSFLASFFTSNYSKKKLLVQIITSKEKVLKKLKNKGYSASIIKSRGLYGTNNYIIYSFISSKRKKEIIRITKEIDSNAFISINSNKELINGYFRKSI